MPKFTLIAEHLDDKGNPTSTVTHVFNEDFLPDVVMSMQEFLRGTGFYFNGDLDIVETQTTYQTNDGPSSCGWNDQFTADPSNHSDWYFDINRNR